VPRAVCSSAAALSGGDAPGGGWTSTMLPHLGHARICPKAPGSRTRRRARQVVQEIEYDSTKRVSRGNVPIQPAIERPGNTRPARAGSGARPTAPQLYHPFHG
jgi:hypothetical protein